MHKIKTSDSSLKTFLKRNGFRGLQSNRYRRKLNRYFKGQGRFFRLRAEANLYGPSGFATGQLVVDVSEPYETFDRFANSTERTILLERFLTEFKKAKHHGLQ